MAEVKNINFTTKIKSLERLSFSIDEPPKASSVEIDKITFEIGFAMEVMESQKLVMINNPIQIFSDSSKRVRLGSLHVKGEFLIENFEEIKQENGIPVGIIATYLGITISAARGMLCLLSKGTLFENAIIPIVNPTALLQNNTPVKP